jgi:large subunit ribosomal protein L10
MLTRAQKEEQVSELKDLFGRAKCIYVADYRGIDVESANQLRRRVRQEGAGEFEYRVSKNRLLKRAAEGSDVASISEHFQGPTAIAVSFGDPAGLARILDDFAKDHAAFELKGGLLDGAPLDRGEIATLATLPSLDELRGMLVGLLQAPASKLARLLNEPAAQLARVVQAKSQEGEAG